jgi:translin
MEIPVPPHNQAIKDVAQESHDHLSNVHLAREQAFPLSRKTIHLCSSAIRAAHRQEFQQSRSLAEQGCALLNQIREVLKDNPSLYYTGYVADAQKEYVEARAVLAFLANDPLPTPSDLNVEVAPYLNGLAEAASELRRSILDALRRDDITPCEAWMKSMDDVYTILASMDFPDAITGGLRRTTDQLRGVLERTRGDFTMALRQNALERRLAGHDLSSGTP